MRVSAIVAMYNSAAYVAETLEHIVDQTHPAHEIVVVDDGSTDESAAIAERFGPSVTLVRHEENRGTCAARNTAIAHTTGDAIAICDADDWWEPTKLERQVAALEADPGLDLVFTQMHEFVSPDCDPTGLPLRAAHEVATGMLPSTVMITRRLVERVGPFDETLRVGDWVDWEARARSLGAREVVLPEVLVHRRLHANNNSAVRADHSADYLHILKRHLDRRRAGP